MKNSTSGRLESVLYNIQNDEWYPRFVDKLDPFVFLHMPIPLFCRWK